MIDYLSFVSPNYFAEPLLIAALAFSISAIGLSWMASEFFSMPSLKAFAKGELRELGVSAVILVLLIGLTLPGSAYDLIGRGLAPPPSGGGMPDACPEYLALHPYNPLTGNYDNGGNYAFAQAGYFLGCRWGFGQIINFFSFGSLNWFVTNVGAKPYFAASNVNLAPQGVMTTELISAYRSFMLFEMFTGLLSTFAISVSFPVGMVLGVPISVEAGNLLPGIIFAPINEAHTLIVDIVGTLLSAIFAQKMLLDFIELNVPTVLLPLGLVMRAFPFTRKTGSTIVAFSFVAYFIFPLSILLNARLYQAIQNPPCEPGLLPQGGTCNADSQCCSGICIGNECQPKVGNFLKYESTLGFCGSSDMRSQVDSVNALMDIEGQKETNHLNSLGTGAPGGSTPSKTQEQLEKNAEEQRRRSNLNSARMLEGAMNYFNPLTWAQALMNYFEWVVMDTAKLMVLVALFIVMEIVVTLTLYKDISMMIGGEPKIIGISKLV